jgi:hypothetical protein
LLIARAIEHAYWRAEALRRLTAYLPESDRAVIAAEMLAAARTLKGSGPGNEYASNVSYWAQTSVLDLTGPAKALARVAHSMPKGEQLAVLKEAVNVTRQMLKPPGELALAGLAGHFVVLGFREEAYVITRSAPTYLRAEALAVLIPHLPTEERTAVFLEVIKGLRLSRTSRESPYI